MDRHLEYKKILLFLLKDFYSMPSISSIKSYIYVGRLLHLITIFEILVGILLLPLIISIEAHESIFISLLKVFFVGYLISFPILSQLDARSRFQNYKQIKDQFYIYGFQNRILQPVLKSRCQRDAALISAKELGLLKECKDFFRQHNYRWYHLLPDFVLKKPQFLFTRYFWQTTFFTPTYHPKVDYRVINVQDIKYQLISHSAQI